ncbi:MAG: hypothetical protein HONBIEJF_02731 [Fimbriimonadaceae bacterium]|nr:hypothetical protein [Fimbriimonadaceae bacterium]
MKRARSWVALAALCGASTAWGFKIQAVIDSSLTSHPNAAEILASIQAVIDHYEWKFTDPITAKVLFRKTDAFGISEWGYYWNDAWLAINQLYGDSTSADDAEATSHLHNNFFGSIAYNSINGRALGLNTPGFMTFNGEGGFDGAVNVNPDVAFFDHNSPIPGKFDFFSMICHELDEVLGTGSGVGNWLAFTTDLYRYDGNGNRFFSGDTNVHTYFSINGTNRIVEYNQYQRTQGPYGDWAPHNPSMTQDWVILSGIKIEPGEPEFRLLDVIGYDRSTSRPQSYTILRGTQVSGNLESLFNADSDPLVVKMGLIPFQSDFPVRLVLDGTSRFAVPGKLRICLTSKVTAANIGQTVELYDYSAGIYEVVDYRVVGLGYTSTIAAVTNPARFVAPGTRQIQARIKFKSTTPIQAGVWSAYLDQAVWEVTP